MQSTSQPSGKMSVPRPCSFCRLGGQIGDNCFQIGFRQCRFIETWHVLLGPGSHRFRVAD